jgi:hypothetical protein
MIIFGLTEVITSFRHEFFGLTTSQATISTIIGATIGISSTKIQTETLHLSEICCREGKVELKK